MNFTWWGWLLYMKLCTGFQAPHKQDVVLGTMAQERGGDRRIRSSTHS